MSLSRLLPADLLVSYLTVRYLTSGTFKDRSLAATREKARTWASSFVRLIIVLRSLSDEFTVSSQA